MSFLYSSVDFCSYSHYDQCLLGFKDEGETKYLKVGEEDWKKSISIPICWCCDEDNLPIESNYQGEKYFSPIFSIFNQNNIEIENQSLFPGLVKEENNSFKLLILL